ncbi:MAG: hypothetical protein ABIF40_04505 [archaeon]
MGRIKYLNKSGTGRTSYWYSLDTSKKSLMSLTNLWNLSWIFLNVVFTSALPRDKINTMFFTLTKENSFACPTQSKIK